MNSDLMDETVTVTHSVGFFSCCSVRLAHIIAYFNTHNCTLPKKVDSSRQFHNYKTFEEQYRTIDITYRFFQYEQKIKNDDTFPKDRLRFGHDDQYEDYQKICFKDVSPFVVKYFSLSDNIRRKLESIEQKYTIDYENTCTLFYRGNDKATETEICSYDDMFGEADKHILRYPESKLLVQTDETEFIQHAIQRYGSRVVVFYDEIRHIPRNCHSTVDYGDRNYNVTYSQEFVAIVYIMSKCRWVLCTSGNCSLFLVLYRQNCKNVRQFLHDRWLGELE
jgi:hypothetical protein